MKLNEENLLLITNTRSLHYFYTYQRYFYLQNKSILLSATLNTVEMFFENITPKFEHGFNFLFA